MNKTIENLKKLKSFHNGSYGADIDKAIKALEQEPKKIGHWIKQEDGTYKCSNCKKYELWEGIYCASCGAKMESEVG